MIPFATGTLAFIVVEGFYLQTMYNLEAGFMPALVAGCLVGGWTSYQMARKDARRDAPGPAEYCVPLPVAIAAIKRVLKTYSSGRDRWHINYDDKQTGEIQASFHLVDDSFRELRWLVPSGRVDKNINLQLWLVPKPKSVTELHIRVAVDAPITRLDCNVVINETINLIDAALQSAEQKRSR
jgi:hypothetical protein